MREVESGFAYTPTTTFETFPFPDPTDEQRESVGEAARQLVELPDPEVLERLLALNLERAAT